MVKFFVLAVVATAGMLIPHQNTTKGEIPPVAGSLSAARALLEAVKHNSPDQALDFFFPAAAFDLVKDLPIPGRYHRKLLGWYREDIAREHPRFARDDWQVVELKLGRCRWQEPHTEGNIVPYWSCRKNVLEATDGERTRRMEIHVLINWGQAWYVTHLGPIRK